MKVALDRKELAYSGRIDMADPGRPEFIFPASSVRFRFFGKKAVLTVKSRRACWDNYAGAIVDGIQKKWLLETDKETSLVLVEEEEEGLHDVLFFKRQDPLHREVRTGSAGTE